MYVTMLAMISLTWMKSFRVARLIGNGLEYVRGCVDIAQMLFVAKPIDDIDHGIRYL
jgi:hypothetical protein